MKNIIITEKPSVAQDFARFLGVSGSKDGYLENDKWIITWCYGHLVTLSYPQKYDEKYSKWNIDDLPFLPEKYKYEVIANVKKQFYTIKDLYHRDDISTIYLAGDPAREGITIQSYVLQQAGYNKSAKVLVVWVDSLTDSEMKKGLETAKPLSSYRTLIDSGYERAIEDYAVGINYSRALSCKFGFYGPDKKYHPVSVGRVMTTVLGMVVDRENEIKNFKETVYYRIVADVGFDAEWKAVEGTRLYGSDTVYNQCGFLSKGAAGAFIFGLSKDMSLTVKDVKTSSEKKNPPSLFNLAELQSECTKRFKISPQDTLNVAQKLYESKLTTYPRTDARVLTKAMFSEIKRVFDGLIRTGYRKSEIEHILSTDYSSIGKSKKYVDDSKVSDHYAIIPTGLGSGIDKLSDLELKVYHLIVDRFLAIFYPPAEYKKTAVTLFHSSNEYFFATSKELINSGFLTLYENEEKDDEETSGPIVAKTGDILSVKSFGQKESKTQPPKRYTSGSIILAMENAGKLIEDEELRAQIKSSGIGTSATRAGIIQKLIDIKHLSLNKKTQILSPSEDGYIIYNVVKKSIPSLLKPEFTANWEKGLSQIESGTITKQAYHLKLEDEIKKNLEVIKGMEENHQNANGAAAGGKKEIGNCPLCGKKMFEVTDKGYGCSGFKPDKSGCNLFIPFTVSGKKLGSKALSALLEGKNTDKLKGFKKKDGSGTFDAVLGIKDGKVSFIMDSKEQIAPSSYVYTCPKCGHKFEDIGYALICQCGVKIYRKVASHILTDNEMSALLAGRTGAISDFKKKDGTPFSSPAALILDENYETKFKFINENE